MRLRKYRALSCKRTLSRNEIMYPRMKSFFLSPMSLKWPISWCFNSVMTDASPFCQIALLLIGRDLKRDAVAEKAQVISRVKIWMIWRKGLFYWLHSLSEESRLWTLTYWVKLSIFNKQYSIMTKSFDSSHLFLYSQRFAFRAPFIYWI